MAGKERSHLLFYSVAIADHLISVCLEYPEGPVSWAEAARCGEVPPGGAAQGEGQSPPPPAHRLDAGEDASGNQSFILKKAVFFNLYLLRTFRCLNPFLASKLEHLSYQYHNIQIWILEYPIQAISDLWLNNIYSCKDKVSPQGCSRGGEGYEQTKGKTFYPRKGRISPQEFRYITQ